MTGITEPRLQKVFCWKGKVILGLVQSVDLGFYCWQIWKLTPWQLKLLERLL